MANLFMRFPNGKAKALTLSYDDGVEQDIRLIQIMNQNGLKGTFNLNSGVYADEDKVYEPGYIYRRMTKQQVTEVYGKSGQEVAVHSLTHPFLEQLPIDRCTYEITKDRENLENQFHTMVRGMAYPFGTYSDEVVESLKSAGIAYARTVISTEDFRLPADWLRLTATCHHRNEKLMQLAHQFVEDTPNRTPWLFYLWGHSYEFDEQNNWDIIEGFAEYIGDKDDIWYATNIEIYNYIKSYEQLQFSIDGNRVYNPTAMDVCFECNGDLIEVKSGEFKVI